ncbi:MAG: hypothetical protein PHZ02_01510 [Desulfocapsaceae bacterium]|nr:hypothetical protein [Desulfocapsaceae bacterium]
MDNESICTEQIDGFTLKKKIIKLKNHITKNDDEKIKALLDIIIELTKEQDNLQENINSEDKKLQDEIDCRHGWIR